MRDFIRAGGNSLNRVLGKFGVRIVRNSAAASNGQPLSDPRIAGLFVECIGPSGVGKSTILSELIKRSPFGWFRHALEYKFHEAIPASQRLLGDEIYTELLQISAPKQFRHQYPVDRAVGISRYLQSVVLKDRALIASSYLDRGGVFLDEGLIHNHTRSVIAVLKKENRIPQILKGRIFIYFHAPIDEIMRRLEQRAQEKSVGGNSNWLSYLTYEQVKKRTQASLESKRDFMAIWSELGGKGFIVDLAKGPDALSSLLKIEQEIVHSHSMQSG